MAIVRDCATDDPGCAYILLSRRFSCSRKALTSVATFGDARMRSHWSTRISWRSWRTSSERLQSRTAYVETRVFSETNVRPPWAEALFWTNATYGCAYRFSSNRTDDGCGVTRSPN